MSEFEKQFQAFVDGGGLDETRPISEDYERMLRRQGPKTVAKPCKHGKTPLSCSACYFGDDEEGD